MRIAILGQRHSIHTVRWVNALAARDHEVHLLSSTVEGERLHPGVTMHRLRIPGRIGYFGNALQVRTLLQKLQPDVLNTHFASGYGTLARLSGFLPNVLSVWGTDVYKFPLKSKLHHRLLAANLRTATWICSTSHAMADQVRSIGEVKGITVTPFGIDTKLFTPREASSESEHITIGTVKTMSHKYGIDVLLRAFSSARAELKVREPRLAAKLRLRLVGTGESIAELQTLAGQLGLTDVVSFVGAVSHDSVPQQLRTFDIYCALSREESFGVAVLEASACGLPVIVSDVGGLPEVVLQNQTGLIVPTENAEAAAIAIVKLVEDADHRRRLGMAGRQRVVNQYDWSTSVSILENVLTAHSRQNSR